MTKASSDYLNQPIRSFDQAANDAIAARSVRKRHAFPAEYYINTFQDKFGGEAGQMQSDISETYEEIIWSKAQYKHTLHVWSEASGELKSEIVDLEDAAHEWRNSGGASESFLYANSAGRRL